jgi:hypothetical protein
MVKIHRSEQVLRHTQGMLLLCYILGYKIRFTIKGMALNITGCVNIIKDINFYVINKTKAKITNENKKQTN